MTIFETIPFNNIDEFAEWLNEYGMQDFSPWDCWFDNNYCKKCEPIFKDGKEYCWCELNNNICKFFKNANEIPYGKTVVKMWLESKID